MVAPSAGRGREGGVKPLPFLLAAALLAAPAEAVAPAGPPAPAPAAAPSCAAERVELQAERAALHRTLGDIALGKNRRKRKVSGGEVAAGVAGTAASVFLPFGVGALLSAGAGAAARSGRRKRPEPPPPDVPAMVERMRTIDARLAALGGCAGE
jgi:hypothetical protein